MNTTRTGSGPLRRRCSWRRAIVPAAAVLLAAGAWAGWEAYGEPRWQTKRWGAVEPGLVYRSGRLPLARAQAVLARHGIRVLIDLTEPGADNRFQPAEQAAAEALGIDYHNFPLCGDGTDLCGILVNLEGESATEENLAFVGRQVMQAEQVAPNQWKGELAAGGISAEATVTMTSPDTIDIQGCRAGIFCQTLTYTRA